MDTTAHGLAFALMSIAANTSVQERLAKELDEAGLLLSTSNQKPRPLFISDLSKAELPYLDAVGLVIDCQAHLHCCHYNYGV